MTDEKRLQILAIMVVWAVVWVCIVAVLKARQSEEEKAKEMEYDRLAILPYISNTDFWIGMSIWWPILLALSPFYLLYKAVFHVAKPKGASK